MGAELQYRTVADMNQCLRKQSQMLCQGIDVIVGVPRSGLLAANLLALHANLPLADLEGFIQGRTLRAGYRGTSLRLEGIQHALVLDDSVCTGAELSRVRSRIADAQLRCEIVVGAVYVAPGREADVDRYCEVCDVPRVFEWNVMHHSVLKSACVDIDGVLCRDPTSEENDDGERYVRFIREVPPLVVPSCEIHTLVTCRLEKYRPDTVAWLNGAGIRFRNLVMLDLPDGAARRRWGRHGEYKGEVYRKSENRLFIESASWQAYKIADVSLKPVVAMDRGVMVHPGMNAVMRGAGRRFPIFAFNRAKAVKQWLLKRMHPRSYGVTR